MSGEPDGPDHGAFAALDRLARSAQGAVGSGERVEWRPGAHGDAPVPKPALAGDGVRYTLSRLATVAPGPEGTERDAAAAAAALEAAGCAVRVDAFADGTRWVRAERDGDDLVLKLAVNGNRLVTAQSPGLGALGD